VTDEADEGTSGRGFALFPLQGCSCSAEAVMPRVEENQTIESTTEARAAVTGHNVRYVLLIGTLAVIVLFFIAYFATRW